MSAPVSILQAPHLPSPVYVPVPQQAGDSAMVRGVIAYLHQQLMANDQELMRELRAAGLKELTIKIG